MPPRIIGNYYNFDPLTEAEKDDLLTRAGQLARVLGITPTAGTTGQRTWRVADPAHPRFDEEISNTDMVLNENFVHRGNVGLYVIEPDQTEPVWVAVEKVKKSEYEKWLDLKRAGPGRDIRILPVHRDVSGRREMTLRESLNMSKRTVQSDNPFSGPSAASEVFQAVNAAGMELHLFPAHWEIKGGIKPTSGIAREHRLLFDILRLFQTYDQFNLLNSAGVEAACRRIIIIQRAVRKNPKAPDFTGLDQFLQSSFDETGGILTSEFDKYMAETQKTNAMVLKQTRLWSEEVGIEKDKQNARATASTTSGGGGGAKK